MIDLSGYKKLSIGGIELKKLAIGGVEVWRSGHTNLVPSSIDTDGSIYQGVGYIEGYRLSSSGGLSAQADTVTTGFMPCTSADLIRMYGVDWFPTDSDFVYLSFYDANFSVLGSINCTKNANQASGYLSTSRGIVTHKTTGTVGATDNNPSTDENGVITFDQYGFTDGSKVAYFRINGIGKGKKMVVTVNEEINIDDIPATYTNVLKTAVDTDGSLYNGGKGYKDDVRVNSSHVDAAATGWDSTGYIPIRIGDIIRFKNCKVFDLTGANGTYNRMHFHMFDESFTYVDQSDDYKPSKLPSAAWSAVYGEDGDLVQVTLPTAYKDTIRYVRITMDDINENSIITINEEID